MTAPDTTDGTADPAALAARIREAREYLGFSVPQAAERLGLHPVFLRQLEDAEVDPPGPLLARIAKLYMRPVEWFTGGWRFEPSPGLLRMAEGVRHPGDREAILDFAEFLQCKKETETHG